MKKPKRREDFQHAIQPYLNSNISKTIVRDLFASTFNRYSNAVRVSVNGQDFVLPRATCVRIPTLQQMLATRRSRVSERRTALRLTEPSTVDMMELCFERNATVFAAVVDYAQNYELHMPHEVCPKPVSYTHLTLPTTASV